MQKILNKIIIIIFFLTTACAESFDDIKKGLGGAKRTSTDEFLVRKKEPLVMPPEWKNLPEPGGVMKSDVGVEEATDIEELLKLGKNEESSTDHEQGGRSLEESILEKIK